jgi:hypothetical protein
MKQINYVLPLLVLFVTSVLLQASENNYSNLPIPSLESETTAPVENWKIITTKNHGQTISLHLGEKLGVLLNQGECIGTSSVTISDKNILAEAPESHPDHFVSNTKTLDLYGPKTSGPVTVTYHIISEAPGHKSGAIFTHDVVFSIVVSE